MKKYAQQLFGVGIASTAALVLSGCSVVAPIWVSGEGVDLTVLVCATSSNRVPVDTIQIATRSRSSSGFEDTVVWTAATDSAVELVDKTEIVFGDAPEGFSNQGEVLDPDIANEDLYVSLTSHDVRGQILYAQESVIDGSSISSDEWVNQTGTRSADPC